MSVEARKVKPGEQSIELIIHFDPRLLRKRGSEDNELDALISELVVKQFNAARGLLEGKIRGYVDVEQALIDETH